MILKNVNFLHVEYAHFHENDMYSLGKRVNFGSRIMTPLPGQYSTSKNEPHAIILRGSKFCFTPEEAREVTIDSMV